MENEKHEAWNQPQPTPTPQPRPENKKVIAGIMGILFGGLGIHKFILGYTNEGLIQIAISIFTCGIGSIVGFIEGIIYLTKTDEEFYQMYQVNKKAWF